MKLISSRKSKKGANFIYVLILFTFLVFFLGYHKTHGNENELNYTIENFLENCIKIK